MCGLSTIEQNFIRIQNNNFKNKQNYSSENANQDHSEMIILYLKDWQTLSLIIQLTEQLNAEQWKLEDKIWKLSCESKNAHIL